ncbi:bifunctional 2-polyprenyl-6-hydroxyphenol methylase/3-demethylubiquinol 3-O-methyltransferase UbiG [Nocardioides sp. SR21]|uniref:class I SAM-dependent methyltransferase n=1 Tax=Nocardioides sp. SR21 TaxID=2919501 RepID=UPI001FAA0E04|nr:class I SAM-dependent methyltransferase [Nocardioides sp. SR21]
MTFDFQASYDELNPADHDYRFYAALPGSRVLDLGCGTGTLALLMAASGRSVVAIDPDPEMLRVARTKGASDVDWRLGYSSAATSSSVDLAVMSGHVAQVFTSDDAWAAVLADLHRALVPGGTLAFETRNPAARAWERWTRADTLRTVGDVEFWHETVDVSLPLVTYDTFAGQEADRDVLAFRDESSIRASLVEAGFEVTAVYGDWDRSPLTGTSPEIIVIAQR